MGLPKIWVETLNRLKDIEERVGRIELSGHYSPLPDHEPEPEPEPKPESDEK